MSNVSVSMKLTPKHAGALYVKSMKLEDEVKSLKAEIEQLREEKVQAGRDGFIAGLFSEIHQPSTVWNREERANEYANQLRQQAKGE